MRNFIVVMIVVFVPFLIFSTLITCGLWVFDSLYFAETGEGFANWNICIGGVELAALLVIINLASVLIPLVQFEKRLRRLAETTKA